MHSFMVVRASHMRQIRYRKEPDMDGSNHEGRGLSAKHQKFRDLAESRTNKALDAIGRIGNLSNRSIYEWDEAEVRKVVKALKDAVSEVEARFASPKGKASAKFKL
jgi:hypothetical protein